MNRHCRKRACPCSHVTCDRGWVDKNDEQGRTVGTSPCSVCREELAVVVLPAQTRRELALALADHRGGQMPAYA